MRRSLLIPAMTLGLTLSLSACQNARSNGNIQPPPLRLIASADLHDGTSKPVGRALLLDAGGSLVLRLDAQGVTPGAHGLHFHAVGSCEGPAFASAGPHLNPQARQHGHENPAGSHLGDLPNVTADSEGRIAANLGLSQDAALIEAALFDGDGAAIVLHGRADDYLTDPSGGSGERIACGLLRRGSKP